MAGNLNTARSHDHYGDYSQTVTSRFQEGRVTKACRMPCLRVMSGPTFRRSYSKPVDRTGTVRVATDRPVSRWLGIDAMKPSRHARVSFARTGHQGTRQPTPPAHSAPQMPNPAPAPSRCGVCVSIRMGHRGVEPRTSRLSAPSHSTTDSDIGRHGCRSMSENARAPVADVVRCRNRYQAEVGVNGHTNGHTRAALNTATGLRAASRVRPLTQSGMSLRN